MKKFIFIFFIAFVSINTSEAQIASNSDDLSFLTYEHTDPEKKWPECEAPEAYFERDQSGYILIIKDFNKDLDYELTGISAGKSINQIVKNGTSFSFDKSPKDFKIRIQCEKELFSEWGLIQAASGGGSDNNISGVINNPFCFSPNYYPDSLINVDEFIRPHYTILNQCLLVSFPFNDFCSNENDAYTLKVVVLYWNSFTLFRYVIKLIPIFCNRKLSPLFVFKFP